MKQYTSSFHFKHQMGICLWTLLCYSSVCVCLFCFFPINNKKIELICVFCNHATYSHFLKSSLYLSFSSPSFFLFHNFHIFLPFILCIIFCHFLFHLLHHHPPLPLPTAVTPVSLKVRIRDFAITWLWFLLYKCVCIVLYCIFYLRFQHQF